MCCYLTRTTEFTHQLIRDNLHETPTYGGWVEAKGPRYCPSIEDKVYSFLCICCTSFSLCYYLFRGPRGSYISHGSSNFHVIELIVLDILVNVYE